MNANFQVFRWKLAKFFMLFSKPQVSFSLNFASISSVMKDTFHGRDQEYILIILSAWIKIHQILDSFETTNQFFFKFCINLQCHETQLLCTFLSEILYTFPKRAYQGTYLVKSKVWNFALWCAPFVKII